MRGTPRGTTEGGAGASTEDSKHRLTGGIHRDERIEQLRASLWFVPAVSVVAACAVGAALTRIDVAERSWLGQLVYPGGAGSARSILQTIAGSVITVTGVVFSLTVVTLQLASSQFSPRLLRTFIRDIRNQVVLATFLATFAYCLVTLRAVRAPAEGQEGFVPGLAITGAYVFAAASVIALVFFIDHIARSIRIDSLMRKVNDDTEAVIGRFRDRPSEDDEQVAGPPARTVAVRASRSGFVQALDEEQLCEAARRWRCDLWVASSIGEHVVAESPIAWVLGPGGGEPDLAAQVNGAIQVGFERTMQQDVAFGLRQLVDVAVKALSPAVNDPTTAVHAIGHLAHLLVRIEGTGAGRSRRRIHAEPLVVVRERSFAELLELACGQIRRYGAGEPDVMVQLLRLLAAVAQVDVRARHVREIERQADLIVAAAAHRTDLPADLEAVHEARSALAGHVTGT